MLTVYEIMCTTTQSMEMTQYGERDREKEQQRKSACDKVK